MACFARFRHSLAVIGIAVTGLLTTSCIEQTNYPSRPESLMPLVGAIRWDNWTPDSPHNKVLLNGGNEDRIPFFATDEPGGTVLLGGIRPVAAAENLYGRAAGLDYWLFNFYLPTASFGRDPREGVRLNRALAAYRALADRGGMRFAVILQQTYPREDLELLADVLGELVADHDHLRLADGSAPLFLMGISDWEATFGNKLRTETFLHQLRVAVARKAGIPVRLYIMDGHLDLVAAWVGPGKPFEGFTTYADAPPNDGVVRTARQCAEIASGVRAAALRLGVPYIPNITLGWDMRPLLGHPDQLYGRSKTPGTCATATADDWKRGVAAGLEAARMGAGDGRFESVLLYAWNEFAEGGWIAPTRAEGVDRVAALAGALGRSNRLPNRVSLTYPDDGDPSTRVDEWPCPPGLDVADERPATPDGSSRALHPGAWTQRSCRRRE